MDERRRRVRVDSSAAIRALGPDAAAQLRTRTGDYLLLPSPLSVLLLKRLPPALEGGRERACRLAGEITAPGAICDVVSFLGMCKWLGELAVLDGENSRSIFFDRENVVSASSSVEHERLGQVLYRHGALTRQQLAAATDATRTQSIRFGEATVQLGFLSPEELFRLMEVQAREIFEALLRTERGTFYVLDGFDERTLSFRVRTSIMALLADGVRRMDEMKYFRERIPSADHVPWRVVGRSPPDEPPNPVYAAVDGYRSVSEICRVVRGDEFSVTRTLFELAQAGYLEIRAPRPRDPRETVEVFNRAMVLLMRELDAMDVGDGVREQLALFAAEGGVYDVLFEGAGPCHDGSLDTRKIEENFARLSAPADAAYLLAEWLHEYASYALFLAKPHLQRADEGLGPPSSRGPTLRQKRHLSDTFRAVLSSIAPPPQDDTEPE